MNKTVLALAAGAALLAQPLAAQSFSRNPHPPD
jgi:hypothetical protein